MVYHGLISDSTKLQNRFLQNDRVRILNALEKNLKGLKRHIF
jgi:hypothetical protein